jgi:heme exporter protein D
MPNLGPHAVFILAAYGVTFAAITLLASAIIADDRRQQHLLADLERKGIRRRSAAKGQTARPGRKKRS